MIRAQWFDAGVVVPKVSVLTAIREFGGWHRFELHDWAWFKWRLLAILLNSAAAGVAIMVPGHLSHASSMHLEISLGSIATSAAMGVAVGLIFGSIPALLVGVAARALTRRIGYINGQLAVLYAAVGVGLSSLLISVFAVVVLPAVLVVTFVGWIWCRTSGDAVETMSQSPLPEVSEDI